MPLNTCQAANLQCRPCWEARFSGEKPGRTWVRGTDNAIEHHLRATNRQFLNLDTTALQNCMEAPVSVLGPARREAEARPAEPLDMVDFG